MEPIREIIANKNNYVRVMPFLDNVSVQKEILRVRSQIPNFDNPTPWDKYDEWYDYMTQAKETIRTHRLIRSLRSSECVKILENYGRQDIHYHTLWKAIVCGELRDEDCASVWVDIVYPDLNFSLIPRLVLVIQPQSTHEEITKVLKERDSILQIQQYEKFQIGKGMELKALLGKNVNLKMLKIHRKFYILHKYNKFSYQKIANTNNLTLKSRTALEYVRTRIESYKNRVEDSIRINSPVS